MWNENVNSLNSYMESISLLEGRFPERGSLFLLLICGWVWEVCVSYPSMVKF